MTQIILPTALQKELLLQQQLSKYCNYFSGISGELALSIAYPPDSIDTRLQIQWQGISLVLYCHGNELAHWLAPDLQQAALFNLPEALKLASIEQLGKSLKGGLTCLSVTWKDRFTEAGEPALQLLLQREETNLALWAMSPEPLLTKLPQRRKRLTIPLAITFLWGDIYLTITEIASLAAGDVLLPTPHPMLSQQLLICIGGRPFAYSQIRQQQLELTTMYTPNPDDLPANLELETLPIQVSFEVGRQTVDWHTLTTLEPGSLIDLVTPLDGEVRIISNGRKIGTGRLVDIQGRLGVRIESLNSELLS